MQVVLADIEQIRQVLGKRPPRSRSFSLADAEPRQVYFQAQTLFRKCNLLAQEMAGVSHVSPPPAPDEETTPADVLVVVQAAQAQLGHVKTTLGIDQASEPPRIDRRRQSADVMHDIIHAGYVLNQISQPHFDWARIYDRVVQLSTYLGGLLPEEQRYPVPEAHACCKMPGAVNQRLRGVMELARPLAESVDLTFVRLIVNRTAEGGPGVDTVYDLTTTLLGDFGELALRLEGEDVAPPDYPRPARIHPSHVYQLTSVLEQQVGLILAAR